MTMIKKLYGVISLPKKVAKKQVDRPPMLLDSNSEFVYKRGSDVQAVWRKYGWTPPTEMKGEK